MHPRILVAIAALSFGTLVFFVCGQNHSANNPPPGGYIHLDVRGDCLGDIIAVQDSGYLETEVIGHDLYLRHWHAYYNCCLGYKVDYTVWENAIVAVESDTGTLCRCDCTFDLESTLYDLRSGNYVVTLIGISGEVVGLDTVDVL